MHLINVKEIQKAIIIDRPQSPTDISNYLSRHLSTFISPKAACPKDVPHLSQGLLFGVTDPFIGDNAVK